MEERVKRTIARLKDWQELARLEANARATDQLTEQVADAIKARSAELGRAYISEKTGLDLTDLSPAQEKIVLAVSEYVGILRGQGKYPGRTLEQLRNHGLLEAAERAVSRATPTQGFQSLAEADREELSYEKIVVDHPEAFSPRALWFSRRTLGLQNESHTPPAGTASATQTETAALIQWLKDRATRNGGVIAALTNADVAAALGMPDMQRYGRVLGNIQSRIDFACYVCNLPPLGLVAAVPFDLAWAQQDRDWAFPVAVMQAAAQSRVWTAEDLDRVLRETQRLPGQAHALWKDALSSDEAKVKAWAFGLQRAEPQLGEETVSKRNPTWSRDELILALELYLRHRASPPGKDSAEIRELSAFLSKMGRALGRAEAETYRNTNGVYMKMMNFSRFDDEYTRDGKVGLTRGNKDEEVVWREFSADPERLGAVSAAIRSTVEKHLSDQELQAADDPGIQEAEEGRVLTRLHQIRERSRKLVQAKKAAALKQHGRLACEACGFDFSKKYGSQGEGLIDVHHTKPVHTLTEGDVTKLDDLVLLCANCHRVVHSSRQWLTVAQVRKLIADEPPTPS